MRRNIDIKIFHFQSRRPPGGEREKARRDCIGGKGGTEHSYDLVRTVVVFLGEN